MQSATYAAPAAINGARPAYNSRDYWKAVGDGRISEAEARSDAEAFQRGRDMSRARHRFGVLPGLGFKTFSKDPVWTDSARGRVTFQPMSKREALKIWHEARAMNRDRSAVSKNGARRSVIGAAGMAVLQSLLFDFLNYKTGQLDPSYEGLALKTGLSRATVARALARLKALGIIHWQRRCAAFVSAAGRFCIEQLRNAYAVLSPTGWRGHTPTEARKLEPHEWGAAPPSAAALDALMQREQIGDFDFQALLAHIRVNKADPVAVSRTRYALRSLGVSKLD